MEDWEWFLSFHLGFELDIFFTWFTWSYLPSFQNLGSFHYPTIFSFPYCASNSINPTLEIWIWWLRGMAFHSIWWFFIEVLLSRSSLRVYSLSTSPSLAPFSGSSSFWKFILQLKVFPKVRIFLRRHYHDIFLTKSLYSIAILFLLAFVLFFQSEEESMKHIMFDFPWVRFVRCNSPFQYF